MVNSDNNATKAAISSQDITNEHDFDEVIEKESERKKQRTEGIRAQIEQRNALLNNIRKQEHDRALRVHVFTALAQLGTASLRVIESSGFGQTSDGEQLQHNTDCAKKVVLHGVKGWSEDDIKAMLGASKVRNVLKKHNTAFVVLESETYAEAVLRNNVPIPAEVEAQRFNQRPRDPIKAVSKRLTKMYKELLAVVTDLSRQVSELKQAMTTGSRIPLESPSPMTPDRVPESPHVTPTTTVDWESMMPESPPSATPTATPEPTATTVFRPVFSILDAQEKNDGVIRLHQWCNHCQWRSSQRIPEEGKATATFQEEND